MASDPRDYKLELSSVNADGAAAHASTAVGRPFLSVLFACCGVYQRIYRSPEGDCYVGRCPKCGKSVRFPIGQQGTAARFFTVS